METVAIVGVGLIGGSFALALREAGFSGTIVGVSSERSIEAGKRIGAISRGVSLAEAAQTADLLYIAQPIGQILRTIESLGRLARPDCLITDAGSTKVAIVEQARKHLPEGAFLGGHPMAGKEQRGVEFAESALFRGRSYVITPTGAPGKLETEFRHWLTRIGARVIQLTALEHDQTVALTSHLPQLLSTALAVTLAGKDNEKVVQVFGPGLLDMTRLALSAPEVWMSVLATNKSAVMEAISSFEEVLREVKRALGCDRLSDLFEKGSEFSTSIRTPASQKDLQK